MKNLKNLLIFIPILLITVTLSSCGDDDETPEEVDVFLGCCSEEPVYGDNVDNLDQSVNGEISVYNIFTPNNDAWNDFFKIENIDNYNNHVVTIYDINDNVVLESDSYGSAGNFFPDGDQGQFGSANYQDGTYKYKIVIENEQTFLKSGTFCLFGDFSALDEQNFSDCTLGSLFDPTLSGN